MALNIKDAETDRLARELAQATGQSITMSLKGAIEEQLKRVRAGRRAAPRAADLQELIDRGRARKVLDERSADQILGYDADGLPR
jgi:antitoxin VapB